MTHVLSTASLDRFRGQSVRLSIHPWERALLWLLCSQLIFLPWALGGMKLWSQWIALAFGALSMVVALIPRNYHATPNHRLTGFRVYTWPRLARFPIFWIGLIIIGYIVIQAFNSAWEYKANSKWWWMVSLPHIGWLPSGVKAPISRGGPWRTLIVYTDVWLTTCALWVGISRRRSCQILFTALAVNGFALACLGLGERALNADKIFWYWPPPAGYFVASFIYKNHAGAYFDLVLSVCTGLAYWHYRRSQRRGHKSSPAGIFALFGATISLLICFSYARTATLLMFGYLFVLLAIVTWRHFSQFRRTPKIIVVFACVAGFIWVGLSSMGIAPYLQHLAELRGQFEAATPGTRRLASEATWNMAKVKPWLGWGAGSFRFLFPVYQRQYPEITNNPIGPPFYWEHAHNDYLEGAAEFGIIGGALCITGLAYALAGIFKKKALSNPLGGCVAGGLSLTLLHNTVDFNFQNPAILITWCLLAFATARWTELEEPMPSSSGGRQLAET